uniref:Zinc finger protein 837 n=1 Tax=Zeugodacus cucurbitae TaxID=28588 RepID=A0A0A1XCI9_ZEUCU
MSFAFKIDKALKANLYKICRLCGIDRDDKYDILDADTDNQEPVDCDEELKLHQKIIQCIGITVCKEDKMPQSACGLCVDKINDFYEFREMCYATDVQTRKLLGLKVGVQKKIVDVKPCIEIKEEVGVKRGRKRKSDEIIAKVDSSTDIKRETVPIMLGNKKQRLNELPPDTKKKGKFGRIADKALKPKEEIKEEPMDMEKPSTTNTKYRHVCNICDQGFVSRLKLDQHIAAIHTPNIPRYICTACNETIKKTNDIKSHQLWHKLSKTPYICGHCGQSLISSYAYSRHLRDHTVEIPQNLWVLDRECPQCHQTFLTNFLYNTHPCAVRTKKCAGCNRQLRNEVEYQRHAAHCAKVYLNYSKHIPVAALAAESTICIKNENEVEAAAAEAFVRNAGISLDMTPIVSLTRISTPEIIAASHGTTTTEYSNDSTGILLDDAKMSGKKGSKKGVSRKDLKRVDNLLKSTLDVLVSIKHEPEVHVEIDSETPAPSDETAKTGEESAVTSDVGFINGDNFHHGDDDDDDDGNNKIDDESQAASGHTTDVAIKLEPVEDGFVHNDLQIKQEANDIYNENPSPTTKMPVLKLKIKKEHGTLNSSIVEEQNVRVEKKKKKKKRKDAIRSKDKFLDENEVLPVDGSLHENSEGAGDSLTNQIFLRPIKQEQLGETDEEYEGNKLESNESVHTETTVMTTIPIPQFQITAISSGVEFASSTEGEANDEPSEAATTTRTAHVQEEDEDIKPNKAELDRLFEITNVSCGVQMDQEPESEIDKEADCNTENSNPKVPVTSMAQRKSPKTIHKVVRHKFSEQKVVTQSRSARAFKSTSGVSKTIVNTNSGIAESNLGNVHQIQIKPEPVDRGYEDIFNAYESATNSSAAETLQSSMREIAEQDYINKIDFATIQIKQEKDIEVSDVEMTNTHIVGNAVLNGKRSNGGESQYCENDEDSDSVDNEETDDDEDDDDNDDDWVGIKKVVEEKREYRELEMPPLLSTEVQESNENVHVSQSTFPTRNLKVSLIEIADDFSSVGHALESGNVEQNTSECVLNNTTSLNEPITSALLVPPLMITGIYSQSDGGVPVKSPQTNVAVTPHSEIECAHGENEPIVEMPTLKITSVIAGCSNSFVDLPQDYNQLIEKTPPQFAGQLSKVDDVSEHRDSINEVTGTYPEARTMSFEVNQNKDGLLDAQPFSDVRTETEGSSQTILHTNIASNSAQNHPAELLGESLVEEEQNFLNQEVVEAQAIQRLIHDSDQPIPLIAPAQNVEEAENLMNESVAEAQLQQRQEPQAEFHTGGNMSLLTSVQECCDSASGSVEGCSQIGRLNHTFLLDETNINEIAENNNNANIERELQDEATTTASSNTVNSIDSDTDRRSNTDIRDTQTTDIT